MPGRVVSTGRTGHRQPFAAPSRVGPIDDVPGVRYGAYFGDMNGVVYAVNAETGAELWTMRADDHPQAKITCRGKAGLVQGRSSCTYRLHPGKSSLAPTSNTSAVLSRAASSPSTSGTAEKIWQTYRFSGTSPGHSTRRIRPAHHFSDPLAQVSGARSRSTKKRRAIYAPTGNCNITQHFGISNVSFDGGACDSILAVDMDTGRKVVDDQPPSGVLGSRRRRLRARSRTPD